MQHKVSQNNENSTTVKNIDNGANTSYALIEGINILIVNCHTFMSVTSQNLPMKFLGQKHLKDPFKFTHVAPFSQGFDLHSSTSLEQVSPS